ncbi:MAG: V-type ATP synthase subunit D [Chlamydiae bacterium]|nr:V-type ATP synthase subunit D [Chlamydiota bacterium]
MKLTKTELRDQQVRLQQLERYLPTLQLKKAMLQAQANEVRQEIIFLEKEHTKWQDALLSSSALFEQDLGVSVEEIGHIKKLEKHYENIAGVELPVFDSISFESPNYSLLATEPYLDQMVNLIEKTKEAFIKVSIAIEKKAALEKELREVSIRVNLFEKILIPRTKLDINRIKIFLGDQQLAAVARAKIAKKKIMESRVAS